MSSLPPIGSQSCGTEAAVAPPPASQPALQQKKIETEEARRSASKNGGGGGETVASLPIFWPPPDASTHQKIPRALLVPNETQANTWASVAARLEKALADNGYSSPGYYAVPEGFALISPDRARSWVMPALIVALLAGALTTPARVEAQDIPGGFSMVIMSDPQVDDRWRNSWDRECITDLLSSDFNCRVGKVATANAQMRSAILSRGSTHWPPTMDIGPGTLMAPTAGIIINGDLTEYFHAGQVETFSAYYEHLGLPIFPGLGNHDYHNNLDPSLGLGGFGCDNQPTILGPVATSDSNRCAKQAIAWMASRISRLSPNSVPGIVNHDAPAYVSILNQGAYCFDMDVSHAQPVTNAGFGILQAANICSGNWGSALLPAGHKAFAVIIGESTSGIFTDIHDVTTLSTQGPTCLIAGGDLVSRSLGVTSCFDARALPPGGSGSLSYSFDHGNYHFVQLHNYPGYVANMPAGGDAPIFDANGFRAPLKIQHF